MDSSNISNLPPNRPSKPVKPPGGETRAGSVEPQRDQVVLSTAPAEEASLIQPQLGRQYQANETTRPITLTFDERAVAFFQSTGLEIDIEQARIVSPDGRQTPLDVRSSHQYAVAAGQKLPTASEPWQFRVPGMPTGVFGKPYGVHLYGGDSGIGLKFLDASGQPIDSAVGLDDFQGMRVNTKVFRRNRRSTLGQLALSAPDPSTGPAQLPFTDSSTPNVTFRAPNQKGLDTVTKAFDSLLGSVARERVQEVDLQQLARFENSFQERVAAALASGGDVDGYSTMISTLSDPAARDAFASIHGPGAESLGSQELFSKVSHQLLKASPLEIIVMPKDKTALDCVTVERESTRQQLSRAGRAYFLRTDPLSFRAETGSQELPSQKLFVGEEILETEQGVKAVLMHELLHVFEHLYANEQEGQQIEASFQQATEFQSLYGSSRDEYITTVGEEFLGTHGPDGPAWAKRQHRPVYDLLAKLTGSDPVS